MRRARLTRLLRILRVFARHGLDEFVSALAPPRPYRWLLRALSWSPGARSRLPRAARLRCALEELGPIFVKFGQILSTRPDLLPPDIAHELSKLQDQVPPFAGDAAVRVIEQAYGGPLNDHFSEFDLRPIASASVAQVHFAQLKDGTEVAVKILRPGIEETIERDLALLYSLARFAQRFGSDDAKRLRPVEVVDEYNYIIHGELDLIREAANASQLRANFAGSDLLYVPQVYWDYTRTRVLVMERIAGIPISDVAALRAAGVDMRALAHHGVQIFFTQAFRDGFFHADMHPGNIFVSPEGQYRAIDFGIMGTLSARDQHYLAENFLGFFNRDYRAIANAHLRAGWVPAGTRVEEFEAAIRSVCEPIFAKPLKDISFGRLLLNLFQTARRFNMSIQPQLVLLQKTLFNIEGLGRRLYPELDLWVTAKPFLEHWMRERVGPKAWLRSLRREAPRWATMLPQFPGLLYETLQKVQEQDVRGERAAIERLERKLQRQERTSFMQVAGATLIVLAVALGALNAAGSGAAPPLLVGLLGLGGMACWLRAWLRVA